MARDWPYRRWLKSNGRPPAVPDLDLMDEVALRAWIAAVPRGTLTGEAAHAFPGKPPGYVRAYRLFLAIAHAKLKGRPWAGFYKQLPEVAACGIGSRSWRVCWPGSGFVGELGGGICWIC